eukprot:11141624-Lingulodinium_polyedra.AAC.1
MFQDGLRILPHGIMHLHMLHLKFVVMRITSIGIHGPVSTLELGTASTRAAIEEHITSPPNNLADPAS